MSDSPFPDDTSGWGERRLRRLAERLAQEEAAEQPAERIAMTRRQLRDAQRAVEQQAAERQAAEQRADTRHAKGATMQPDADPQQHPQGVSAAPSPDPSPAAAPEPPPHAPSEPRPRPPARRPVVRPPASARRADEPVTGPIPVVRVEPSNGRRRPVPAAPAPPAPGGTGRSVVPDRPLRARRRWPWVVAVAVLLVAAVVAALLWQGREPDAAGQQDAGAPTTQRTLALALTEASGDVSGAALLGTDGQTSSALLIPSRLLVDVAGGGRVPVADALDTGDAALGQAVEDALDVRVDATWVLTTDGLRALVDGLGGITVDVTTSIASDTVAIPAGPGQRLDGEQAATYAAYLGDGEPETARSARMSQVLTAVLVALPHEPPAVEALLRDLGDGSRVTAELTDVAAVLVQLASTAVAGSLGATVLPVQEIATGGDEVVYGLDDAQVAAVLDNRFAGARRPGGADAVRVLVQNGVGTPGLGEQARARLVEAGFRYVGGGNATTLGRPTTVVAIASDSQQDRDRGTAVAKALGLPPDVVAVGRDAPTLADVVVVLGADFEAEVQRST